MTSPADLRRIYDAQRAAYHQSRHVSYKTRLQRLDKLIAAIETNEQNLLNAVNADFGHRSRIESMFGEIVASLSSARLAKKDLKQWMAEKRVKTPLMMKPGKSRISPQPLGVVGIISPWNYPVYLALSPLVSAIAGGNRVMIKPSELTPKTSEVLKLMIGENFLESEICVVPGGVETAASFAGLPFDHILFTGSTAIGRKVAQAAASNLTPLTLELGGKSPAIIDTSATLEKAARSIAFGKAFNSGQTCVAPDYILTTDAMLEPTVDAVRNSVSSMYPDLDTTPDYSAIISDRHFERLCRMIEEAKDKGLRVIEMANSSDMAAARKIPFTIIVNPSRELRVMNEEIFGPILPIISLPRREDIIDYVNAGDRPLALYWFGNDLQARDQILRQTVSGGVTVNDTNWHVVQEHLPFGGVGQSGYGTYHGYAGFKTFSHMKPVFYQSRFANTKMLQPPYNKTTERVLGLAKRYM